MQFPKELKFEKSDEWVKLDGELATLGISDFAQNQLSDVVYFEIAAELSDTVSKGDALGTVESVKAAAEVVFPLSGEVVEVNETLADQPEILNSNPYGEGWMIKIKLSDPSELEALMDANAYEKYCQER